MKHDAIKTVQEQKIDAKQIVVIGYGNTYRRDDGAGVALAEKLAAYWLAHGLPVQLLTSTQLLPEMAADIAGDAVEAVVFVDATTQGSQSGIHYVGVEAAPTSPSSGHSLNPSTLLVYTGLLYGCFPRAWLVTIPGVDFAHGQGFSPEVTKWLNDDSEAIALQLLPEILAEI